MSAPKVVIDYYCGVTGTYYRTDPDTTACPECQGFGLVRRGPVVDHRCVECAEVEG